MSQSVYHVRLGANLTNRPVQPSAAPPPSSRDSSGRTAGAKRSLSHCLNRGGGRQSADYCPSRRATVQIELSAVGRSKANLLIEFVNSFVAICQNETKNKFGSSKYLTRVVSVFVKKYFAIGTYLFYSTDITVPSCSSSTDVLHN